MRPTAASLLAALLSLRPSMCHFWPSLAAGEGILSKALRTVVGVALGICVLACLPALGDDFFPITGTYIENQPCKGDGSDPVAQRVKITANNIDSNFGLCALADKRREGNKFTVQVQCKDSTGTVLMSDVTFTLRNDKVLDFTDQYQTYTATLHKCPD
jgi:hypothetical protein